ncbi:hypothetical protein P4233_30995 [Pseudomonas aeruginosa]|nr:hypothetical protein [Pseudomonas aeruginosa]
MAGEGFQVVGIEQEAVAAQGVLVHTLEHHPHEPCPLFVRLHAGIFALEVGVDVLAVAAGAVGIEELHAGTLGDLLPVLGVGEYPQRGLGQCAEARRVLLHVRQRLGKCRGLRQVHACRTGIAADAGQKVGDVLQLGTAEAASDGHLLQHVQGGPVLLRVDVEHGAARFQRAGQHLRVSTGHRAGLGHGVGARVAL